MRRVGGQVRRACSVVTPAGWLLLTLVAAGAALGLLAGWVEAWALAIFGGVVLLIAVAAVLGGHSLALSLRLDDERIRVGSTATGRVTARNESRTRSRAITLELPVGQGVLPLAVPGLPPDQEWSEEFTFPARRRGVVPIGPARTVRGDALGLTYTERVWGTRTMVYVHPEVVRVPFDATGFQADAEGVTTARLSSSDVSFHTLRDYVAGDDRRHVHWPTTARTGRLMLRHFEETRRSHHVIVLPTEHDWPGDDFETAVAVTASLAMAGLTRRRAVSVSTGQGWLSSVAPVRLLDALTEVQPGDGTPGRGSSGSSGSSGSGGSGSGGPPDAHPLDTVVRHAVAARRAVSVLTVISPADIDDVQIARWARLAGVDVTTGVVRVGGQLTAQRRTVAGARVIDCPSVHDLPRLLAAGVGRTRPARQGAPA